MAIIKINKSSALKAMRQDNTDTTLGDSMYGFNTDFGKRYLHPSRNNQGLCFFVRPQLNLTDENIRYSRLIYGNVGGDGYSIPAFVRQTLDPRLAQYANTEVINNKQAFIPLLTNALTSLSGFPDIELPSTSTSPGLMNEVYTLPDGATELYGPVEISASFANTTGEPVMNLFHTWITATSLMIQGKIRPYADFIAEHERCFDTRIFRLILDQSGKYVRRIGATGPGFVDNVGIGAGFNYNSLAHFVEGDEVNTFRFKMAGVEYRDPILIYEFNKIGEIFQPLLEDEFREMELRIVPQELRHLVNYMGYPRIDPDTMELQMWIEKDKARELLHKFNDYDIAIGVNTRGDGK